jgi:hypothetical protein
MFNLGPVAWTPQQVARTKHLLLQQKSRTWTVLDEPPFQQTETGQKQKMTFEEA